MIESLLLLSGNDIPFPEARVTLHQPTLKEIAYIGETAFFVGCGFLNFSKNLLNEQDKTRLANIDDFDIFMSIIMNKQKDTQSSVENAMLVLTLIFPLYEISVRDNLLVLSKDNEDFYIDRKTFPIFKQKIISMFNLEINQKEVANYNPSGNMAKRIAEKFKKRHEKLMQLEKQALGDDKTISILQRYVSILAVGLQKDLNDLMQYTVYQLLDEFQRYQLKLQWDAYIQAKMAGAKDLEEVDNWMIDLKKQGQNKNKKKK